jgi:hypothetical protein
VPVIDLEGVTAISAGAYHSLAIAQGSPPPPNISVTPGHGSLTVHWLSGAESKNWHLAWRLVTHPAGKFRPSVALPPSTRSYTVTGLGAQPTELRLQDSHFGPETVTGTPLA